MTGEELVEELAEGIDVGTAGRRFAPPRLGGHVQRRPRAGDRERGLGRVERAGARPRRRFGEPTGGRRSEIERERGHLRASDGAAGDLGEPEVDELGDAVVAEEGVGGLDVAVEDAGAVGGGEAAGEIDPERDDLLGGHGERDVVEGVAGEELGDEEGAVADLADVVDGDEVRVLELGDGAGLDGEAGAGLGVRLGAGDLEGDGAIEQRVAGQPDVRGRAAPEPAFELELGDLQRRDP